MQITPKTITFPLSQSLFKFKKKKNSKKRIQGQLTIIRYKTYSQIKRKRTKSNE